MKEYLDATVPELAFGEYWDTCEYTDGVLNYNQDAHRQRTVNWCDRTGGTSAAFDFTTKGAATATPAARNNHGPNTAWCTILSADLLIHSCCHCATTQPVLDGMDELMAQYMPCMRCYWPILALSQRVPSCCQYFVSQSKRFMHMGARRHLAGGDGPRGILAAD